MSYLAREVVPLFEVVVRRLRVLTGLLVSLVAVAVLPAQATASTISGTIFQDADRDGTKDAGETPLADQLVYLTDAAATRTLAYTGTDASGRYSFAGLADGRYSVEMDHS